MILKTKYVKYPKTIINGIVTLKTGVTTYMNMVNQNKTYILKEFFMRSFLFH